MSSMGDSRQRIIFFDGVCGLCNTFADWVIKRDSKNIFLFAPIQGQTAKEKLGPLPENSDEWSIIYSNRDQEIKYASTAVLDILRDMGGGWKILSGFSVLPVSFRDWVYRFIAKRRYRWFKKRDVCRIPTQEERHKFLP
ncbi:MAG: thiol-disulfide oxidoreductase DCC family protein [Candidatus Omnitrophota bacterium]